MFLLPLATPQTRALSSFRHPSVEQKTTLLYLTTIGYCPRTVSNCNVSYEQAFAAILIHMWEVFPDNWWHFLISSSFMLQNNSCWVQLWPASCCLYALCIPQAHAKQTEDAACSQGDCFYNGSAASKERKQQSYLKKHSNSSKRYSASARWWWAKKVSWVK